MLLQSMLMIAVLLVIGSALLTSTLVSAKTAFHQTVEQKSRAAMSDATADFVSWAQAHVKNDGLSQTSVWSAVPQQEPLKPACGATQPTPPDQSRACPLAEQIRWNATGYTGDVPSNFADPTLSDATALSTAQDEQRISATITVAISDTAGHIVYDGHSREITARLFHAFPYVAITGSKDVVSASGDRKSSEGDTGGHASPQNILLYAPDGPTPLLPAAYSETNILTTVNCVNTAQNGSSDPSLDDSNVQFATVRNYGNLVWLYEAPCNSLRLIDPKTIPPDYITPNNNLYFSNSRNNKPWAKNDDNISSFSR